MKKEFRSMFSFFIVFILFYIFISPTLGNGVIDNRVTVVQSKTKEVPIEFSHSEDFLVEIAEKKVEAEDFNGSEFLDALDSFNQTGINVYTGTDIIPDSNDAIPGSGSLSYLVLNITESYIYADHDSGIGVSGYGEIYYKIWANGNYSRYPEEDGISATDGQTLNLDIIAFEGWTWNNTVVVEVWESDTYPDPDDYLGTAVYSTGIPMDETVELRTNIDGSDGDANVTIQFNVTGTKTTFSAEELLWGYQPYLYIDDETSGTEEPDGIYGRVCIGNDPVMGKTLWALQYFFYWDIETYGTSLFEVQLHKYDYEEVIIFLDPTDILKPVRMVFDQAINPAFPSHDLMVYELNPTLMGKHNQKINFTEEFQPFLGVNLTIDYEVKDLALLNNNVISSQFGGQTFKLTIDTFYHAFTSGEGSNETAYNYQVHELNDEILKDWYSHLNESLHGNIHNIPVIVDYTTPEISPFTFDVTNPFQRPHIINAWVNVMEDLDVFAMAQSQDITMSAEMNITITLAVEAILTIEYPEEVLPGKSYDLNYSIEMMDDTVILTTDYDLDLNISANFWFLGGQFLLYQNGSFTVDIPLATINGLLDRAGVSPQSFVDKIVDKLNEYLTAYYLEVEYITVSPKLLGTVLNASIRLHFWDIAKDFIPAIVGSLAPQFYPAVNAIFRVLDRIISHIDLQAIFLLQTMISGDIALSDTKQAQLSQNSIEFNESDIKVPVKLEIVENPTNPNLQVTLDSLSNGLNFFIEWYFDAGLEAPFSFFIDDFRVFIGRYPSYEMDLPEGWIVANVSSISVDVTILGVTPQTTTRTTTTTTAPVDTSTKSTSEVGPGFLVIEVITLVAMIGIFTRRKRKTNW